MRWLFALTTTVTVFSTVSAAQSPGGAGKDRAAPEEEKQVRELMKAMQDAATKRERATIERYHAEGFTMIQSDGSVESRKSWIDQMVKGELGFQKFQKGGTREELEEDFRVAGPGIAIATSLVRFRNKELKRDVCLRSRQVFQKQDGEWRLLSAQSTLVHEGPVFEADQDGLTGKYEIGEGRTFTITLVGGTLFGTNLAGGKMPLFPTADGMFDGPLGRVKFTFIKDDKGRASAVTPIRDGKEVWRAKRVN